VIQFLSPNLNIQKNVNNSDYEGGAPLRGRKVLSWRWPSPLADRIVLPAVGQVFFNPLPPSDAVRKQKKKIIFEDLFSSVLSEFKKYHPYENLKFKNFGIFKSLKLRNLMGKIF